MIWAQWTVLVFTIATFFLSVIPQVRKEKTNTRAALFVAITIVFIVIEACAGTFSHIIGWPR